MKRFFYLLILVLACGCALQKTQAQFSLGFSVGPQYAVPYITHTEGKSDVKSGWGFNAGLVACSGDDRLVSFRGLLNYSLQNDTIELKYLGGSSYGGNLKGSYWMSNILFSPQLSFNLLKNKNMFIAIGPFMQYMVYASGKGTYSDGYWGGTPFSGKSSDIFNKFNWGGGLSFGCQKIKVGKVNLSMELRELMTVQSLLKEDLTNAEWLTATTSLTVGIEFYRGK
ncbi:MAG: hypothetical protein WCK09_13195 [Bacteroidota bacterium]